jgi:hypothetical protein
MDTNKQSGYQLSLLGAERAATSANRACAGWTNRALALFEDHARKHEFFTTEEVRLANPDFEIPPDKRAWGHVARNAQLLNIVKNVGVIKAKSSTVHNMWVTKWQSLVVT